MLCLSSFFLFFVVVYSHTFKISCTNNVLKKTLSLFLKCKYLLKMCFYNFKRLIWGHFSCFFLKFLIFFHETKTISSLT